MSAVVLILLAIIILIALGGFAVELLWWVAVALLVLWVLGWILGAADSAGRRRWYGRW